MMKGILLLSIMLALSSVASAYDCLDSDDGKNEFKQGYVHIPESTDIYKQYDNCYQPDSILPDGTPERGKRVSSCSSDDLCYVVEAYCSKPSASGEYAVGIEYIKCLLGCEDGACLSCEDSDKGEYYYIKGVVKTPWTTASDRCDEEGGRGLFEYVCSKRVDGRHEVDKILYDCPYGCRDGACMSFAESIGGIEIPGLIREKEYVYACQGCQLEAKICIPVGTRLKAGDTEYYCGLGGILTFQGDDLAECQNNYECKTNLCLDGTCLPDCTGCFSEDKACMPFGFRTGGEYCDIDYKLKEQRPEDQECSNNYECATDTCLDGKCEPSSMLDRVIKWIRKMIGV
ncbi:MAG: hypothetical protein ABIH11_06090 [Candidatus Altiarchaeota archaeon]